MWGVKVQGEQGDLKEILLQNRLGGYTGGSLQVCWYGRQMLLYSVICHSCCGHRYLTCHLMYCREM